MVTRSEVYPAFSRSNTAFDRPRIDQSDLFERSMNVSFAFRKAQDIAVNVCLSQS